MSTKWEEIVKQDGEFWFGWWYADQIVMEDEKNYLINTFMCLSLRLLVLMLSLLSL
jgi:hypothetical protein